MLSTLDSCHLSHSAECRQLTEDLQKPEMDSFDGKFSIFSAEQMEEFLEALLVEKENISVAMDLLSDVVVHITRTPDGGEWVIKYRLTQYSNFVTIGVDTKAEITTENNKIVVKQISAEKALSVRTEFELDRNGELIATSTVDTNDKVKCVMKFKKEF